MLEVKNSNFPSMPQDFDPLFFSQYILPDMLTYFIFLVSYFYLLAGFPDSKSMK